MTKKAAPQPHPNHFTKLSRWQSPSGRWLDVEEGTEFSVTGLKGRFRFLAFVRSEEADSEWVDAYGPVVTKGAAKYRSFPVGKIKAVHTRTTVRPPSEE